MPFKNIKKKSLKKKNINKKKIKKTIKNKRKSIKKTKTYRKRKYNKKGGATNELILDKDELILGGVRYNTMRNERTLPQAYQIVIDEKGRNKILENKQIESFLKTQKDNINTGYKGSDENGYIAHHMTILFLGRNREDIKQWNDLTPNEQNAFINLKDINENKNVDLTVTHIGHNDKAIAVKVSGYEHTFNFNQPNRAGPHITLAVKNDGTAVASNNITDFQKLEEPIKINGTIKRTEFK